MSVRALRRRVERLERELRTLADALPDEWDLQRYLRARRDANLLEVGNLWAPVVFRGLHCRGVEEVTFEVVREYLGSLRDGKPFSHGRTPLTGNRPSPTVPRASPEPCTAPVGLSEGPRLVSLVDGPTKGS